jgi:hypothetical protein
MLFDEIAASVTLRSFKFRDTSILAWPPLRRMIRVEFAAHFRGPGITSAAAGCIETEAEMIEGSCHCGAVRWCFEGMPESATACNCTVCRRYGVLWAYDYDGEGIAVSGPARAYVRGDSIAFHFCAACGCVAYWRALEPGKDGRLRIAVNLRLTEPEPVARVPIDHFDGFDSFEDLPRDGRCVADYWF